MKPTLPTIIYAEQAVTVMKSETMKQHGAGDQETGGILVGCHLDYQRILIMAATEPGPNAVHYSHMFAPDVDYANQEIVKWQSLYPTARYVGIWHKHPSYLDHPSSGDESQITEIFSDPDYDDLKALVLPITLSKQGQFLFKTFYADRSMVKSGQRVCEMTHSIISNREAAKLIDNIDNDDYIPSPDLQERVSVEITQLAPEYITQLKRIDDQFIITAQSRKYSKATVYFVLTPNFPEEKPSIYAEWCGQEFRDSDLLDQLDWVSDQSKLIDFANRLISQVIIASNKIDVSQRSRSRAVNPNAYQTFRSLDIEKKLTYLTGGIGLTSFVMLIIVGSIYFTWFRPSEASVSASSPQPEDYSRPFPQPTVNSILDKASKPEKTLVSPEFENSVRCESSSCFANHKGIKPY